MGRSIGTIPPHDETGPLHRNPVTWFLVADGARAQVYVRKTIHAVMPLVSKRNSRHRHYQERVEPELVAVANMRWQAESPEDFEFGNHEAGRTFESAAVGRHMVEPRIDIREELKLRFMRTIAGHLQAACQQKQFDRLVLIAPPKLLGELKKHLPEHVLSHIVAELPKELTRHDGKNLQGILRQFLPG